MHLIRPARPTGTGVLPRIAPALLLAAALAASGCGSDEGDAPETVAANTATEAPAADTGVSAAGVVVVRGMTQGDRACYLDLEDQQGQTSEAEATFELCERPELVGQTVRLTRETSTIPAMSCEGDPECALTDTVDLIVAAEVQP